METRNRQRTNIALRLKSEDARFGFPASSALSASISNSVIYLNDFSATLNDTDFVNATGTFNLQPPHHYSGKVSANVANLATLQPLLARFGNQNATGRRQFRLGWAGQGMTASPPPQDCAGSRSLEKLRQPQARSGKSALRKFARAPGEHRRIVLARRS